MGSPPPASRPVRIALAATGPHCLRRPAPTPACAASCGQCRGSGPAVETECPAATGRGRVSLCLRGVRRRGAGSPAGTVVAAGTWAGRGVSACFASVQRLLLLSCARRSAHAGRRRRPWSLDRARPPARAGRGVRGLEV